MSELSTVYDPKTIEKAAAETWDKGRYFHADPSAKLPKGTYTIVIPPPNVTAALHLGHALNNTLQDILIRFHRMNGFNTLWMPGTDHAGIATQTVVDKRLRAEGKPALVDYKEMQVQGKNGREQFIGKVQSWKDEYEACIINQLKMMGCSCDWDRTRFTMDETCAKSVRANFFKLFNDGLIYRGKRLVNWDPATQTVLADDEVEHETVQGHFWYMMYPLAEPVTVGSETIEHVTVATTRPETMLGDTAIAMNPSDPRADALAGKMVRLPIVGRLIPIVADEHVVLPDPESDDEKAKFSTGFLKVTPAHDPYDWEIGQRHDLEVINVMAPDGTISQKYGWEDWDEIKNPDVENIIGMDRFEAREAIVEWFRQENLLAEIRDYAHEVGHSYRSHVPIEPYLSDQWYIAVKKPIDTLADKFGSGLIEGTDVPLNSLAGLALKPLLDGRLKFTPERYSKTYQTWLENLRDWPISRQLWWGHRIPIWLITFSKGHHTTPDEPDDAYKAKRKTQFIKFLNSNGYSYSYREFNTDDDRFGLYLCVKDTEFDELLSKAKEILLRTGTPIDNNELNNLKQQNDRFKEKYGNDIFGLVNSLSSCVSTCRLDEDVLDTWFSSALWPFSTLGWPEDTEELKTYYPGNVLCTAREIITLWVSRMVMMGQYCVGDIPFKDVYIHAMIQDGQGRKMSKSLGNGIDPLVAIDSHGADAMRFTLASMTTDTQDVRMPVELMTLPDGREVNTSPKFDVGRNFCNKLWNASRFAMMNLEGTDPDNFDASKLDLSDKWILSRLAATIDEVTGSIEQFKFNEPITMLYRFFWNDYCDWYLEWAKPRMRDENQKPVVQNVLAYVLDQTLRMLHPFIPFITEGIYEQLNTIAPSRGLKGISDCSVGDALIITRWPGRINNCIDTDVEQKIDLIQNITRQIRDVRSQYNIAPKKPLDISVTGGQVPCDIISSNSGLISGLVNLEKINIGSRIEKPSNSATVVAEDLQIFVHDVVDPEEEIKRLKKKKEQIENQLKPVQGKLNNENFVSRAKPEVVEQARTKLAELTEQLNAVNVHLSELEK